MNQKQMQEYETPRVREVLSRAMHVLCDSYCIPNLGEESDVFDWEEN